MKEHDRGLYDLFFISRNRKDKAMTRGTTPLHTFTIPFNVELIDKVRIIYSQNDIPVLKKQTEDCILEGTTIKVKLSQSDTLKFSENSHVEIQVRTVLHDGESLVGDPETVTVDRCLDDEVL